MKNTMNISIKLSLIILVLFFFSCATTQQEIKIPIVDAYYFTVEPPYGVWETRSWRGTIRFARHKYSVFGGWVGRTLINVFREEVKQEGWHLSEEEVADDFRNQEKNIIRSDWDTRKEYKLKDVKKDVTTIGEKKLYRMSYKVSYPYNISEGWKVVEAVLYLYFPPEFKEDHIFYGFLFSESHSKGGLVTFDVELIYPVIDSLKIKNP
jgi:hypothetical protein